MLSVFWVLIRAWLFSMDIILEVHLPRKVDTDLCFSRLNNWVSSVAV